MNLHHHFEISLPHWIDEFVGHWLNQNRSGLDTPEHRMELAIALAAANVEQGTGGPFGAIVVQEETNRLAGVGVNLVTGINLSSAHAEIVALSLAQIATGSWNLGKLGPTQLVTSCEPCAMCFGAVPWSGVTSVVCGASKEDAEAAGFDEGDKPVNWTESLHQRGIEVRLNVMRDEAARVLQEYSEGAGTIYNPGKNI